MDADRAVALAALRLPLIGGLAHENVSAFLRLIRQGETSQLPLAYQMLFGGGFFASFADHPRVAITRGSLTSTAAGAYQILEGTWDRLCDQYGFPDFSPACQDQACVALIKGRQALNDVMNGDLDEAIRKCAPEWASLPGSQYGQPTQDQAKAQAVYLAYGGRINGDSPLSDVA